MTCHPCKHWICETVKVPGGNWAIWKCPIRNVTYGVEKDWKAKRVEVHKCIKFEVR
ncbi:hypothetical protein [Caudoviricetes sp.]|nr:hypothetical protein [Caudoviricetes sp.]